MAMNPDIYRRILDNLSDAVLLFDASLSLVYINMPGEVLFAVSSRQVLGLTAQQLFSMSNADIEADIRRAQNSNTSLTKHNIALNLSLRPVTVNVTVQPILDEGMGAVLVQLQQVDLHLRISMEAQLSAQQSASKMLLKGLAHEIKNPLGGLRGAAQLLDQELEAGELREYTQIIIEESDRLQALLDQMLAPHKLPQKSLLNIHRVLERVRQLVRAEAPPGIRFLQDYDPSIPLLRGDMDQLIQAILNIVRNAAQALMDKGVIKLRTRIHRQVTIGHARYPLAVKIEVIDDGPGVQPELLNQIFYPLVTGRAEGTGLGLSIAQSLISQHGGMVECSSTPGNTVFSIFLPLEKGHE